jgi:hypothetical protein
MEGFPMSGTSAEERRRLNNRGDAAEEMRFATVEPPLRSGTLGNELPVREYDAPTYHAKYRTTTAIIVPDGDAGEIRIPDIKAGEPGDFSRFMDELVERLNTSRVRFVGVLEPELIEYGKEEYPGAFPDWGRSLYEVLDGFEEEFERWDDHPRFGSGEAVNCLVGEWRVEE